MMKKIISVLALGFVLGLILNYNIVSASASQVNVNTNSEESLQIGESSVYGENGEYLGKIVVTEKLERIPRSLIYTEEAKNKNYNIHFIGGTANVGFGITVKDKKITKAYDPWANGFGWSVNPGKLTYNTKEARLPGSFSIAWQGFPAGSTFRLRAVISGSQLQTYLDIP